MRPANCLSPSAYRGPCPGSRFTSPKRKASSRKPAWTPKSLTSPPATPPELVAALQQGRADAAVLSEPGATMATSQGMRQLTNVDATTVAGNHNFTFVSAEPWVKANAEAVRRFNAVMIKANAELNANR